METVRSTAELLGRVRAALRGRTVAEPGLPYVSTREPVPARGRQERIDLFRRGFEELGGIFLADPPEERTLQALGETLRMEGVSALFFPEDDPAARAVADALVPFGPFLLVSPADVLRADAPVSAGIQSAEYAIAETGTLVQTSREGRSQLPGLVSDVHVALLAPDRFLGGMEDCLEALSADPPRNISLITGPSRTADIELTLTVGVHGPRKVVAVLLGGG
ncbi:MAG TPA: LUD domain-containing protein [Candidatus Deferrimicrobiaceae bacterium]|nr:LUD domain-containing protein [Candidatus Deferrimicrobiaceae bacterium]